MPMERNVAFLQRERGASAHSRPWQAIPSATFSRKTCPSVATLRGDTADVDLEEAEQRRTRVAAPEAAYAERGVGRVDIEGDWLRKGAHVVGRGD
jgi:hypothetical protein